jgi:hypothetical protein
MAAGVLAALLVPAGARADSAPAAALREVEAPPPAWALEAMAPGRITTLGPLPPARVILFPSIRLVRPADIPPPKPTKGLGLAFDW